MWLASDGLPDGERGTSAGPGPSPWRMGLRSILCQLVEEILCPRGEETGAFTLPQAGAWFSRKETMVGLLSLLRRGRYERVGFELYGAAVTAARDPFLYTVLGVPDTLDGRFDMVSLHAFLLIRRLKREPTPGAALAQATFDAMFSDMDVNLREMGVGDLSVGRKVRVMWEAFHGRSAAYQAALDTADVEALEAALIRNVWRGSPPTDARTTALRHLVLIQDAHLRGQTLADLTHGLVGFLPAEEASQ
jgi:cytochrome b pre-mRNA-processing protein 3